MMKYVGLGLALVFLILYVMRRNSNKRSR